MTPCGLQQGLQREMVLSLRAKDKALLQYKYTDSIENNGFNTQWFYRIRMRRVQDISFIVALYISQFKYRGWIRREVAACPSVQTINFDSYEEKNKLFSAMKMCKAGKFRDVLDLMYTRGIKAEVDDYACIFEACIASRDLNTGMQTHFCIVDRGVGSTLVLENALVDMYCKCGSLADAGYIFENMPSKDLFTWTTMIAGYAIHGSPGNALELFWKMKDYNIKPDSTTLLSVIKACTSLKRLEYGKKLHEYLKMGGFDLNNLIRCSLVDMYAKCGSLENAQQEFQEMPERDLAAWNAMISGYAQNGRFGEALDLFLEMHQEGLIPDRVTFANVLKACANLQMLESGKHIHNEIIKKKLEADVFLGSSLTHLYAKCGTVKDAWKVFMRMPVRTNVAWNAMIIGYAHPGSAEDSLRLFWQMESNNVERTIISFVGAIKACCILGDLQKGKHVLDNFKKSGLKENLIFRNSVVDMYAKCGNLREAYQIFVEMPERDVISWNSLIAGYAEHGPAEEAIKLFSKMETHAIRPDKVTFLSVLKASVSLSSPGNGKQIHVYARQAGFESDIFLASALVDMYAKCGSIGEAHQVFDRMQVKNEVVWNSLIAGYVQHGHLGVAFNLFSQMETLGIKPVKVTFLSMLKACANLGDLEQGMHMHNLIVAYQYEKENFVGNSLVDMYSKCGDVDSAHHVFDGLSEKTLVSWNALIAGYLQQELLDVAFELFVELKDKNIELNEVTFITLIQGCALSEHLDDGKHVHCHVIQNGFDSFKYVLNSLIDMYSKCNSLHDARCLFEISPKDDLVTWNAMIVGYTSSGLYEEALKLFHKMELRPDEVTYLSLLKTCAGLGNLDEGKEIHASIKMNSILLSTSIGNALIDMYAKCGECEQAYDVFNSLSEREVVSWNAIMTGYLQNGYTNDALKVFRAMLQDGLKPDRITFLSIFKACGSLGCFEQGKQTHDFAEKQGVEFDHFLKNTLIDMYGKCGDIRSAQMVFDDMEERDLISWNALCTGYSQHGLVNDTFQCLQKSLVEGTQLDHVTFVNALSVCNHGGLVEEGRFLFDNLKSVHGINYTQEHCVSMVDILCRAGQLQEAWGLTKKMPLHPGAVVWLALLNGCRLYNNFALAIQAMENIFELQPQTTAPYVILSNICAMPNELECRTESVVDIDDEVYSICAEDALPSGHSLIQTELHRLYKKLKFSRND